MPNGVKCPGDKGRLARKSMSSDPRERAAGGQRASSEGAGVYVRRRVSEGKVEKGGRVKKHQIDTEDNKDEKQNNSQNILFVKSPGRVQQQH